MRFDRIIKNGIIVDGARQPRFVGDMAIKDGVIAEIGRIDASLAREVIDADGLIVAPGFIDLHTHYDAQVFWDPHCTISSLHGVTTVAIGNCGLGFAPVREQERERAMLSMTRIEAIPLESMKLALPWDWVTFPEYLASLDRTPKAMNLMAYAPAGMLMIWAMGLEAAKSGRRPTDAEHAEMRRVLHEAMDAGACGWSTQFTPPDSGMALQRDFDGSPMVVDLMHDDTFDVLASVLGERNEGLIQMLHMCGDRDKDDARFERLARISGRPVLFNAVAALDVNPDNHRHQLQWLASCRERGLRVVGQGFTTASPYMFKMNEWNLFDDLPAWAEATVGTVAERKAKLADPARRQQLREQVPTVIFYLGDVTIAEPMLEKNQKWRGRSLTSLAAETGRHIVDIFLDLAVEEDLATGFRAPQVANNNRDYVKEILAEPSVTFGASDGGAHTRFITNGSYTTEHLIKYTREEDVLSLEEAHWRLSALPAIYAGLRDRGTLTVGAAADIVIYDHANLKLLDAEVATDFPGDEWRWIRRASGYRYVLVNGEVTIRDDEKADGVSGKLIRQGRPAAARLPEHRAE